MMPARVDWWVDWHQAGGTPAIPVFSERRVMSCSICGKFTVPGTVFCAPCRAALKRARQFTVQVPPPDAPRVVRRSRSSSSAARSASSARRPAAAVAGASRTENRYRLIFAILSLTLLALAAYLAGRAIAIQRTQPEATWLGEELRPLPALVWPEPLVPSKTVLHSALPKRASNAAPAPAEPAGSSLPVANTVAAPVVRSVPAASAPAPAPPPDRWQAMTDAIARCDSFLCVQRVRLAACEGYWGRVEQCPAVSSPDNPR
jgi:hypothetical protein